MQSRPVQAESELESAMLGEHGAAKSELQSKREHMLLVKLEMKAKEDAAQAREVRPPEQHHSRAWFLLFKKHFLAWPR